MADTQAKIVLSAEDRTSRVFSGLKANLGGLTRQADAVNSSFIGLNTALLSAFSVVGIASFIGKVTDGVDKLNDLADATGSSVENLSGLEDIGARTGTSIDTVGAAVLKLNKNLLEAQDPASQAAALFKQLGLNVDELSKLDPSQALLRVATALGGFADGADKAQFQLALLGKSTRELAPFLKDLAEKGEINATVTTKQAEEAEKFNQQLFQLQKNITDAARSLVSDLLPAVNTFLTRLNGINAGGGFFKSLGLEIDANLAGDKLRGVVSEIESLQAVINRGRATPAINTRMAELRAEAARLTREASQASEALKGFADAAKPFEDDSNYGNEGRGRPRPSIGAVATGNNTKTSTAKARLSDAQQYLENLQRQLQGTQDLSVAETVLADIQAGRLKLAKGESAQPLLDIATQIDQAKRRQDQLKAEAEQVRQLRTEQEKLRSDGASVFDATRTSAEKFGAQLGDIQVLLQKGAIDSDTYYRRVAQLREEFDKANESKESISELDTFAQRAAQNIQDTLGSSLADVLDGNFKNIGNSFAKLLNRMVAEAAAAQIARALFGDLLDGGKQSSGGGDSGFLGNLFKSGAKALGSFGSSFFSPSGGAATGSNMLERDMITLVHKGEAIVPKQYNPAAGGSGGRAITVNINQTFGQNTSRQTTAQAAADARRALEAGARNL
jgi:hypothetical protein